MLARCSSASSKVRCSSRFIPEDILTMIFIYLPINSIFKHRCVSKVWFSILSNPNFIKKWIQFNDKNKSLLWVQSITVFPDHNLDQENALKQILFRIAYPDVNSRFISRHLHGFSFGFLNLKPCDRELHLLGSSNGVVLLCHTSNKTRLTYYACNPLTQKWVSFHSPPGIQCHSYGITGFFCDYSPSHISTSCFKVVRIPYFKWNLSKEFEIHIFSSDLGEWKTVKVSYPEYVEYGVSNFTHVLFHNNVLYWIERKNKLVVCDLSNNKTDFCRSTVINLPIEELFGEITPCTEYLKNFRSQFIGESEGLICYAGIRRSDKTLSVWVLKEDHWQSLHKDIKLDDIFAKIESRMLSGASKNYSIEKIQILGFSPTDHNMVLLGCMNYMWGFNIQTTVFEELCYPLANTYLDDKAYLRMSFLLKAMPTILPAPRWTNTCADL